MKNFFNRVGWLRSLFRWNKPSEVPTADTGYQYTYRFVNSKGEPTSPESPDSKVACDNPECSMCNKKDSETFYRPSVRLTLKLMDEFLGNPGVQQQPAEKGLKVNQPLLDDLRKDAEIQPTILNAVKCGDPNCGLCYDSPANPEAEIKLGNGAVDLVTGKPVQFGPVAGDDHADPVPAVIGSYSDFFDWHLCTFCGQSHSTFPPKKTTKPKPKKSAKKTVRRRAQKG